MEKIANKIYNTGETENELRANYNAEGSLMRNIQMRLIDMLLYFDHVCKELDIKYYLDCGSCLGAIRHGGFVPWDDDLDVVIDCKDYKRLCKYMKSHPHPQYILHNHQTDNNYYWGWAKLRDLNSETSYQGQSIDTQNQESILEKTGISMDIFIYSDHVIPWINFILHGIHKHITMYHLIAKHKYAARFMYFLFFNILKPIANAIGLVFSKKNYYRHDYCGHNIAHCFKKDKLFPLKPVIFEGHEFMIPHDYDYFLSKLYDNWQTLPPLKERNHHELTYILKPSSCDLC